MSVASEEYRATKHDRRAPGFIISVGTLIRVSKSICFMSYFSKWGPRCLMPPLSTNISMATTRCILPTRTALSLKWSTSRSRRKSELFGLTSEHARCPRRNSGMRLVPVVSQPGQLFDATQMASATSRNPCFSPPPPGRPDLGRRPSLNYSVRQRSHPWVRQIPVWSNGHLSEHAGTG